MFPFGPKKQETTKAYIPVDLVQRYGAQGMSEPEIASRLKSQGFSPGQIDAAMRTVLRDKITGPQKSEPNPQLQEQFPSMQIVPRETGEAAPMPPRRPMPQQMQRPQPVQQPRPEPEEEPETKFTFEEPESRFEAPESNITLEEIIEGVVAEKWNAFEQRLANFEERDLQLEQAIQETRASIKELEKTVNMKEENLSGRFEQFGDSMSTIEGKIGSIEKVFKDFVPELSKNVRLLSEDMESKQ
ncbi:MAG: hypothetical protein PHU12_03155 [Candidatus Aenigmarchaeota archaeon]|nr:hypothetical protein [Candidatus Aenigmarchaeota archaeon]